MRRLSLLGLLLLLGCAGTTGPRMRDARPQKVDPPYTPISKQEERARDRLAFPDTYNNIAPRTYAELPAQQYGRLSH